MYSYAVLNTSDCDEVRNGVSLVIDIHEFIKKNEVNAISAEVWIFHDI